MLIEVITFSGSIDDKGLTYYARDELAESIQIGCLVEVPFRNNIDYAVVTCLNSGEISENPKSIVRIVTSIPLLSQYQIRTIFEIASHYFVHTHLILSLFISKSLIRYLEKKDFITLESGSIPVINNGTSHVVQFLHHTDTPSFHKTINSTVNGSTIIIFPDDFSLESYIRSYPVDSETTLCIPDNLTETKKFKSYISVYNGEKNIIIGTRRILYYNLSRYSNILYIEDAFNKTAMRFGHNYKHLEVLRKIAASRQFNIRILSTLPSIESMYLIHTGVYKNAYL